MASPGITDPIATPAFSEAMLRLTVTIGVAVVGLTLILLGAIIALRIQVRLTKRRRNAAVSRWRPVILASFLEPVGEVPPLDDATAPDVLHLWNYFHESTRGSDAHEALNRLAELGGFDHVARKFLHGRSFRLRVLAVVTLGRMRSRQDWFELVRLMNEGTVFLSLVAARSLIQIDAAVAMEIITPAINEREDWAMDRLSALMKQAGPRVNTRPLIRLSSWAAPERLPVVVRMFEYADPMATEPVVRLILAGATEPPLISACLDVLRDPASAHLVRPFLEHPLWFIRVHAVRAIGRLGSKEDVPRLVVLLADQQWWVRYRAAQSIIGLPFVDAAEVERIISSLTDRYARDIMQQVSAEHGKGAA